METPGPFRIREDRGPVIPAAAKRRAGTERPLAKADPRAPPDPPAVRRRALARADALLAEGRAAEALVQLKAAEALARSARPRRMQGRWRHTRPTPRRCASRWAASSRRAPSNWPGPCWRVQPGVRWGGYALQWRADTFGTEAAEQDRRAAEAEGWAHRYWDESGALKPREPGEMGES